MYMCLVTYVYIAIAITSWTRPILYYNILYCTALYYTILLLYYTIGHGGCPRRAPAALARRRPAAPLYIYIYIYIYIYMPLYIYIYTHIHTYIYTYIHTYIHIYTYIYIYI